MPEFEQYGWQGQWSPARRIDGQHGVVVVVKRRFEVDLQHATCLPVETPPVTLMAEPYDDGEPPLVSMRHPAELAPEKPFCDVMVRGTAFAPGGKPTPSFDVEVRISQLLTRRLRVYGDRHLVWYPPVKWLTSEDIAKGEQWIWPDPEFSEPAPITKLPLRYEYSYGGIALIALHEHERLKAIEERVLSEVISERREKKQEIIEKLKAEEAKANAPKEAPKKPALELEEDESLDEDGLTKASPYRLGRLEDEDEDSKIVSPFRFKDDDKVVRDEDPEEEEAPEEEASKDAEKAPNPLEAFFSGDSTRMLDVSALSLEDELKEDLKERADVERRRQYDDEGTHKEHGQELGDILLHDDSWAAQYMRYRPEKLRRKMVEVEDPQFPFPGNTAGRGFVVSHLERAVAQVPLPNIEDPEEPLRSDGFVTPVDEINLDTLRVTPGWAPFPMAWYPRARYMGYFPWEEEEAKAALEKAKEGLDEDDPDDKPVLEQLKQAKLQKIDPRVYQEAHPKMQVKEIRGDEEVYLTNLTPDGTLFFRLPGVHPSVTIDVSNGPEYLDMRLDMLLFDLEDAAKPAVEMVWRGFYPLPNFDVLGEKPVRKVHVIDVDQATWLDMRLKSRQSDGITTSIKAITDEDLQEMIGEEAHKRYHDQFLRTRGGKGVRMDEDKDAAVFDQTEGRHLVYEEWDEQLRAEKEAWIEEQRLKAEEEAKFMDKARKAKARELADEHFGIIRDPETGEVLAVEPPQQAKAQKGKKGKKS